jgi:hypothetical protein
MVVVRAETYNKVLDAETGTYEYVYTLVGSAASYVAYLSDGATQTSEEFVIEMFRPPPGEEKEEKEKGYCGDGVCSKKEWIACYGNSTNHSSAAPGVEGVGAVVRCCYQDCVPSDK